MATGGYSQHDSHYPDRVFIDGIGPATDKTKLQRYLRDNFGDVPFDIKDGTAENCVAIFKHSIDLSRTPESTLDGHVLHFESVPFSCCLQTNRIPERLTEDAIRRYFAEKNLPGGGGISNIESNDETTLITFHDHKDVDEVCQNENHLIGKHRVQVQIYYEQLHQTGSDESSEVVVPGFSEKSDFLLKDDITEYVKMQIKKRRLSGHWKIQDRQVTVYATNVGVGAKIVHLIKDSVIKTEVKLSQESLPLMDKESWKKAKEDIRQNCANTVEFQLDRHSLVFSILSTDQDAANIVELVNNYLLNHTIYKADLQLTVETLDELRGLRKGDLDRIKQDLRTFHVGFEIDDKNSTLRVTGNEIGVNRARSQVEEIISRPSRTVYAANVGYDVGMTEKGTCVRPDLDLTITVILGDITNLKVDAIVNPTNKDLKHLGGLAKVITQKGGKLIQSECTQYVQSHGLLQMSEVFCGKAGLLPCRYILHCLVPVWQDGRHLEGEHLRHAVQNSLQTACDKKLQSVAIPALSSGVHGMPNNIAADTIVEALRDFFKDQSQPLKKVFLCDIKNEAVDSFTSALQKYFRRQEALITSLGKTWAAPRTQSVRSLDTDILTEHPTSHPTQSYDSRPSDDDDRKSRTNSHSKEEKMSLKGYEMEILKRSDIMKTFKTQDQQYIAKLDPKTQCAIFEGPTDFVTRAMEQLRKFLKGIKKKEGPFSKKKMNCICEKGTKKMIWEKLKERDISCVYWKEENGKLVVYGLTDNDVVATFSTIKDNVTELTIDMSDAHSKLTRSQEWQDNLKKIEYALDAYVSVTIEGKSLVVVTFTVKKDLAKELIEQFFMEKASTIDMSPTRSNADNNVGNYQSLAEISHFKMTGYSVTLMQGNITGVVTDKGVEVVVNSMSIKKEGRLAREIFQKAGKNVEQEIKKSIQTGDFREGDLHITNGGHLRCQKIVHVLCLQWEGGRRQEKEHLFENVLSCLELANSQGLESIVFPPLGTGICAMPPNVSAKTMADAIVNFYKRTKDPLITKIYICCKEQEHVDLFRSKFTERFKGSNTPEARAALQPQRRRAHGCDVTLTGDPLEIKLLKFPATKTYLERIIERKVGHSYDLEECQNETKLWASTHKIAETIRDEIQGNIESKTIQTKQGEKARAKLKTFANVSYTGKFIFKINDNNIKLCGTFDVFREKIMMDFVEEVSKNWCTIL